VRSGDKVAVTRNGNVEIYTEVIEDDSIQDVGTATDTVKVTDEYFDDGFGITQTINVRENRGRYSGNVATWTVKYTFS
jgi:hypothetical protein